MILGLFNEYFLGLVIILSLQVILYDGREFLNRNQVKKAKKARFIGVLYIGIAFLLYLCNKIKG